MEIGDLPTQGSRLNAWKVSVDSALKKVSDRFIGHYDDPAIWGFSIWLGLTDAGERVARGLQGKTVG